MKNYLVLISVLSALPIVANAQQSSEGRAECATAACAERSLNAPIGIQPNEAFSASYDTIPGNPSRTGLRFPEFDPSWDLKRAIFEKARSYFEKNQADIANPRFFMVIDFNLHASKKRLFVFDLSNDTVEIHNVAAAKNSDPDGDGYATKFSNTPGSLMSSLGFYRTLATYIGKHGLSLRLDGLEASNSTALSRAVVIHPADYVKDGSGAGRSWGCPAIDPRISAGLIAKVKNGAMLLIDR
jgi:L,D-transpeptidase catalytic domain